MFKDKYYKLTHKNGIIIYIRFSHSRVYFIYDTSWFIIYDGKYKYHDRIEMDVNGILKTNINNVEEIYLSDIIEYLPIGHPDRICFRKQRIKMLLNYEF